MDFPHIDSVLPGKFCYQPLLKLGCPVSAQALLMALESAALKQTLHRLNIFFAIEFYRTSLTMPRKYFARSDPRGSPILKSARSAAQRGEQHSAAQDCSIWYALCPRSRSSKRATVTSCRAWLTTGRRARQRRGLPKAPAQARPVAPHL